MIWVTLGHCTFNHKWQIDETCAPRIRGEQSANGAQSACGMGTEKNKCGEEAAELIPFASYEQSLTIF